MRLMLNIKHLTLKEKLIDFCKKYDYSFEIAHNFADIFLVEDQLPDIFLCEVGSADFVKFYKKLRSENVFHFPKVIFIIDNDEVVEENFVYKIDTVLDEKFDIKRLMCFSSMIQLLDYEQNAIDNFFKTFGLTHLCYGTKYLEMVIKLIYLFPDKYSKNLEDCYEVVGHMYFKSANAIKKSINRALDYARLKKCKGYLEFSNFYNNTPITVKLLVSHLISNFRYIKVV